MGELMMILSALGAVGLVFLQRESGMNMSGPAMVLEIVLVIGCALSLVTSKRNSDDDIEENRRIRREGKSVEIERYGWGNTFGTFVFCLLIIVGFVVYMGNR